MPAFLTSTMPVTRLAVSFIVALGSGTNYVFSTYSPQLGARLKMSHTQLNIIGLAGNAGVYIGCLIWGTIDEDESLRTLLSRSFMLLLSGYSGIRYFYDSGLPPEAKTLSILTFSVLVFCSFLTGCGGGAGLASTVNSTAKYFPDRERGSVSGLVASAFGLSAFFFGISNMFFAYDTSAFLLFLSLGTSIPMIMGFFLTRPIPPPDQDVWDNYQGLSNNSQSHLLDFSIGERSHHNYTVPNGDRAHTTGRVSEDPENDICQPSTAVNFALLRNSDRQQVWRSVDFWLLAIILTLLSGTGLTYMNNVGSMSQFLYAYKNRNYKDIEASRWQAVQVSIISFMNFIGRIFIGSISRFVKNKYDMPRSYLITLVSSLLLVSQIMAANISDISELWIASSLLGFAHGSTVSLFPSVCVEWFGTAESWGYISASPIVAGSFISFIFGRKVDAHNGSLARSPPNCSQGLNCYVDAIHLTIGVAVLSVMLGIWAGYKDRQRICLTHPARKVANGSEYQVLANIERGGEY